MKLGLFAEDEGHARLLNPLIGRISGEEGVDSEVVERSSAGGAAAAARNLRSYISDLSLGRVEYLDVLVVARDGNCRGFGVRKRETEKIVQGRFAGSLVLAVPDPHIEKWYLADPRAPAKAIGESGFADVPARKCERHRYKKALSDAFEQLELTLAAGGIEYGTEIARCMDLDLASRNEPTLQRFISDLRSALRRHRTS